MIGESINWWYCTNARKENHEGSWWMAQCTLSTHTQLQLPRLNVSRVRPARFLQGVGMGWIQIFFVQEIRVRHGPRLLFRRPFFRPGNPLKVLGVSGTSFTKCSLYRLKRLCSSSATLWHLLLTIVTLRSRRLLLIHYSDRNETPWYDDNVIFIYIYIYFFI